MIYTLAKLRTYTRSVDNRLSDAVKYTDTWIDERIEEGMAISQDIKSIFYTKEKYDLEANVTVDLLTEVEIILQEEPSTIYAVECDQEFFDVQVTPNNHIILNVKENVPMATDFTVTVRYFFYPTMPMANVEMSMEMYKLVKDGIAVACFQWLRDKESEQYHQAKAESYIVKGTFDIEKEIMQIPEDRLWRGSWA